MQALLRNETLAAKNPDINAAMKDRSGDFIKESLTEHAVERDSLDDQVR